MPAPYPLEFRQKILDTWKSQKISRLELAEKFNVSYRFIQRFLKRYNEENTIKPKKDNPPKIEQSSEKEFFIKNLLINNPGISLSETCRCFEKQYGTTISISAMSQTLKRLKIYRVYCKTGPKNVSENS